MKKLAKTIFIIALSFLSFFITETVFGEGALTEHQQKLLLDNIEQKLVDPGDAGLSRNLGDTLDGAEDELSIYNAIVEAKDGAINIFTINRLMIRLPGLAQKLFAMVRDRQLANAYTCCTSIKVADATGDFVTAEEIYTWASMNNQANSFVHNAFITAAGNAGNFEKVQVVFADTKRLGFADAVTYAAFITAASRTGHFNEAQDAYREALKIDEARKEGFIDAAIYAAYIMAAGTTGHLAEAWATYRSAKVKGSPYYGRNVVDTMINVLLQTRNGWQQALDIYKGFYSGPKLNFHDYGFGAAFISCYYLFLESINQGRQSARINVVVGRGNHSEHEHVVRRAVQLFAELYNENIVIDEDMHFGIIYITQTTPINNYTGKAKSARFIYQANPSLGSSHWDLVQSDAKPGISKPVVMPQPSSVLSMDIKNRLLVTEESTGWITVGNKGKKKAIKSQS